MRAFYRVFTQSELAAGLGYTTLHDAKDGWPLFLQGASAPFALELASTSFSPLGLHHLRLAFMAGYYIGCIALHLV